MGNNHTNNNINYSDFLNFDKEEFSRWLRINFELWRGDRDTSIPDLFAPIAGLCWEENVFESFKLLFNSNDWTKTREYFCEGLEDALDNILPQISDKRKRNCAANLINLARVLKENRLIKILDFHIRCNKRIDFIDFFKPVFDGFNVNKSLFDLSLRYLNEVPCYHHGVHLWQSLDNLFNDIEKIHGSLLTYDRARDLFFIGLKLNNTQPFHKMLEIFINRVNKALCFQKQQEVANTINEITFDLSLQLINLTINDIFKIIDCLEKYRKKHESALNSIQNQIMEDKLILIVDKKAKSIEVNFKKILPDISENARDYFQGAPWFLYAIFNFFYGAKEYKDIDTSSNFLYALIIKEIKNILETDMEKRKQDNINQPSMSMEEQLHTPQPLENSISPKQISPFSQEAA